MGEEGRGNGVLPEDVHDGGQHGVDDGVELKAGALPRALVGGGLGGERAGGGGVEGGLVERVGGLGMEVLVESLVEGHGCPHGDAEGPHLSGERLRNGVGEISWRFTHVEVFEFRGTGVGKTPQAGLEVLEDGDDDDVGLGELDEARPEPGGGIEWDMRRLDGGVSRGIDTG
jgi:hypothetical protein